MDKAVKEGLFADETLPPPGPAQPTGLDLLDAAVLVPPRPEESSDPQARVRGLAGFLPKVRNDLAHGEYMLMPGGYGLLRVVAALINQLWEETSAASPNGT